ncbi:hypothetical protein JXA32_03025 [Candidatus Sumerlaeota bacterium]|nr:hypothetical protein [Candidatus Sumerlaeota bacterium]
MLLRLTICAAIGCGMAMMLSPGSDVLLAPVRLVQGANSGMELQNIAAMIIRHYYADGGQLVPESEFQDFVKSNFSALTEKPVNIDSWGTPYGYRIVDGGFEVRSYGPDRTENTPDDIVYQWRPKT